MYCNKNKPTTTQKYTAQTPHHQPKQHPHTTTPQYPKQTILYFKINKYKQPTTHTQANKPTTNIQSTTIDKHHPLPKTIKTISTKNTHTTINFISTPQQPTTLKDTRTQT